MTTSIASPRKNGRSCALQAEETALQNQLLGSSLISAATVPAMFPLQLALTNKTIQVMERSMIDIKQEMLNNWRAYEANPTEENKQSAFNSYAEWGEIQTKW